MVMRERRIVRLPIILILLLIHRTCAFENYEAPRREALTLLRPVSRTVSKRCSLTTSRRSSNTALFGMWSKDEELQGSDRLKACVPYILPLLDGDQFGRYIYYTRFPILGEINDFVLGPLVNIQHHVPFLGVGLFILLTLGTRFNLDMPRNIRFNAQQAALIDVALIIPELIGSGFVDQPLPRYIMEPCSNFVWYMYMAAIIYSVYSNLKGRKPDQIPFISPAADMMVGPF